jgi:DNA-binding CsgD family transcriptional regulator
MNHFNDLIMRSEYQDYTPFFRFVDTFSPVDFKGIDPLHPIVAELDQMLDKNNQFFYVGDILQMKFHYVSRQCLNMLGIESGELSPYHFFEATHPDDMQRHTLARAKLFKMAHDLYAEEKGTALLSLNLKLRNPQGGYSEILIQLYLYYSEIPYKSVFAIKVHTNIEGFKKNKQGIHFYAGKDTTLFRFPDTELLKIGNPLSDREIEIVRLIEAGLSTEQIAEKLFLSPYTINTHRGNILEKTGKNHISDVIYYLKEIGLM